jgi:hypothetical protein
MSSNGEYLIEQASRAGYRLTPAGGRVLTGSTSADLIHIEQALSQGVQFDQIADHEWDGEPLFEQLTGGAA